MAPSISPRLTPARSTCWSPAPARRQRRGHAARPRRASVPAGGSGRLPPRQGLLRVHEPRGGAHPRPARSGRGASRAPARAPLAGTVVTARPRRPAHGRFALAGHRPFRPTGLSVSRRILDHRLALAARAAGAELLERTAVEELLYDGGAVAGAVLRGPGGRPHGPGPAHDRRRRAPLGGGAARWAPRRHRRPARVAFVAHVAGVADMEPVGRAASWDPRATWGSIRSAAGTTNVALVRAAGRGPAQARGRAEGFFLETLRGVRRVAATDRARRAGAAGAGDRALRGLVRPGDRRRRGAPRATPRISSIPSPAKGSTARCAAPSCWPRPRAAALERAGHRARRAACAVSPRRAGGPSPASGRSSG